MNKTSELMMGEDGIDVDGRWILHIRNNGTKSVRVKESVRSRFADHINKPGKEQT